jgi:hypothetical protein
MPSFSVASVESSTLLSPVTMLVYSSLEVAARVVKVAIAESALQENYFL